MSNGEIGPSSPRDNRSSAVEGNLLCAISVLGVLAGLLAATGASCLASCRHDKGGSRDNQGLLPTTKRIIEAVRTSEAQPRRYDPRQRRLYRLKKKSKLQMRARRGCKRAWRRPFLESVQYEHRQEDEDWKGQVGFSG